MHVCPEPVQVIDIVNVCAAAGKAATNTSRATANIVALSSRIVFGRAGVGIICIISFTGTTSYGLREKWYQAGMRKSNRNYDLVPESKRIAVLMSAAESKEAQEAQNQVVFLENFLDELQRKVPVGK